MEFPAAHRSPPAWYALSGGGSARPQSVQRSDLGYARPGLHLEAHGRETRAHRHARCATGSSEPSCCCSAATPPVTTVARTSRSPRRCWRKSSARHGVSHGEALIHIGTISSLGRTAPTHSASCFSPGSATTGAAGATSHRRRRRDAVHAVVRRGRRAAGVHPRVDRQPADAIGRLGGAHQGVVHAGSTTPPTARSPGILSISYLVGDALARQQMGMLIERGYGWRALFLFAAIVAGGDAARRICCCCASRASTRVTRRRTRIRSICSPPRNRGRRASARCSRRCCAAARSCSFACCRSPAQ